MKGNKSQRGATTSATDSNLQEYVATIVRGKWIVVSVFGILVAASLIYSLVAPPVYKASAQVLINSKEVQTPFLLEAIRKGESTIQNELTILNSTSLADTVARRLAQKRYLDEEGRRMIPLIQPPDAAGNPDSVAPPWLISGLVSGMVEFDPVRDSDVITITAKSKDPVEASLIANLYAESYRDRNIYMSRSKSRVFREFLEAQARDKKKSLEETERSLQQYMEKEGIVSLDDEARRSIEQLAELEANRDATDISIRELQNTLASYQEQLPQQETNAARVIGEANDPYIRLLQEQLAKLEVQRDVIMAQNPSNVGREMVNERLQEIDAQIGSLRRRLQDRTDEFLRTLIPGDASSGGMQGDAAGYVKSLRQKILETQIQLQANETKKVALDEVIRQYEAQLDRMPRKNVEFARLQRSRLSNEKVFLLVEEKYNEANIAEQSNIGYIEIIEPAAIPVSPSSPKPLINLALGIVLGLAFGISVVFAKEFFDARIHTPEELKRRGFTPLPAIPGIEASLLKAGGDATGDRHAPTDSYMIAQNHPFSPVAESYRQVRTHLQYAREGSSFRSILVSSPLPGEGKSTTVVNLAIAFAQSEKKVLLVDADLRRPLLAGAVRVRRAPGLAELLAGKVALQAAVQPTAVKNLSVVPSGEIPPNPAELLGSDRMKDFLAHAAQNYDIVLLDSSPILAVTDPCVISPLVDATILVIATERTRVNNLEQSAEVLDRVGGNLVGVLLNFFDARRAYGFAYGRKPYMAYGYGALPYRKKEEAGSKQTADAKSRA